MICFAETGYLLASLSLYTAMTTPGKEKKKEHKTTKQRDTETEREGERDYVA